MNSPATAPLREPCSVSREAHQTLDELPVAAKAVVGRPTRLDPIILRLMEMGLTPGAEVQVTRRSPWGDPLEIRVRGTRLCLRRAQAACFPVVAEDRP